MSVVQRIPGGLLELLSAKTSGYSVTGLLPDVRPTLDMLQMFGLGQPLETVLANGPTVVEGAAVQILVPADQWWMLYAMGMRYVKTATSYFVGSLAISTSGATESVPLGQQYSGDLPHASTAAPFVAAATFTPASPWLLPPGTALWGIVDVLGTDANVDVTLYARIARLT